MKRKSLHSEENFWPSVSDMFLSLFIIALVLYSTMYQTNGNGDKRFAALAAQEANKLFLALGVDEYSENEEAGYSPQSQSWNDIEKERTRPVLAKKLEGLFDHASVQQVIKISAPYQQSGSSDYEHFLNGLRDQNKFPNKDDFRRQVQLLTVALGMDAIAKDNPAYDDHMAAVRKKLFAHLGIRDHENAFREKLKGKAVEIKTLTEQVAQLRKDIAAMARKLEEARATIAQQEKTIAALDAKVKIFSDGKDGTFEDKRRRVMAEVRKVLSEYDLLRSGLTVETAEGVIRIPASTIGFESNSYNALVQKKEISERLFSTLGKALQILAQRNSDPNDQVLFNTIDNIVIESHADTRNTGKYKYGNEELSSLRALYIWENLNSSGKLADQYPRLFSHAGYGSRVLLDRHFGEDEDAWFNRCRRIDIRFNCTPQK